MEVTSKTLLDGKLHMFRRAGSRFWWTGFHHKGRYVRVSTKQTELAAAEAFARDWYFKKQSEIASGHLVASTKTFAAASRVAIEHYRQRVSRGERSANTLSGIESVLKTRVLPFFGKRAVESIDVTTWFEFKEHVYSKYPGTKRGTLHQYKNALRVVLNDAFRSGTIKALPVFKDEYIGRKIDAPRPWFTPREYLKLLAAIRAHIKKLKTVKPRWVPAAEELYDYVIWGVNTGCRVSEIANTRFCDVEIKREADTNREYLIIRNIKGKRGTGSCRSFYGAVAPFRRRIAAHGIKAPKESTELLFRQHHRDMFNEILRSTGLKFSQAQPPARRDFVSLRATYICFRLLNGASVYEVANNCRTSVAMIENSYARYLGGEILEGVNRLTTKLEGWDRAGSGGRIW